MIAHFACKDTARIWNGVRSLRFPGTIQGVARRKLRMLNGAADLTDLRIPPANRLEKLSGRLAGYCSIRVNDQWRIIFLWSEGKVSEVAIVDYH